MLKSILSVAAGFSLWAVIWCLANFLIQKLRPDDFRPDGSTDNNALLVGFLVLPALMCVASGFTTAKLAPSGPATHALILAFVFLAVGTAVQIAWWKVMPLWYHLIFLASLVPFTCLGGILGR